MKNHRLLISTLLTLAPLAMPSMAALQLTDKHSNVSAPEAYHIVVLRHCQVIEDYPMNAQQIAAYQALQAEQAQMDVTEQPIKAIESQLKKLADEVNLLSKLAFRENDHGLYIDKTLLADQRRAAEQLTLFMSLHQSKFDALAQQGEEITKVAEVFTDSIASVLAKHQDDQIHISSPDDSNLPACYTNAEQM
jgi:hypothetical protein